MKNCCARRPLVPFLRAILVQVDTTCGDSDLNRSSSRLDSNPISFKIQFRIYSKYWSRNYSSLFPASSQSRVSGRQVFASTHSSININPTRQKHPTVLICGISSADQEMQMESNSEMKLVPFIYICVYTYVCVCVKRNKLDELSMLQPVGSWVILIPQFSSCGRNDTLSKKGVIKKTVKVGL